MGESLTMNEQLNQQVIYQIYPRSFKDSNRDGIGDLPGITEKLDYLRDLGVTMIWLTPIFKSPNHDNGYDVSDYYAINPEFGTMADFKTLTAQAADRHIGIMLDMVFNHTSDQHDWFIKSRALIKPYDDFYIWRDAQDMAGSGSEDEASFGGSVWQFDELRQSYYYHSFDKSQPDLNWHNPLVREKLAEVVNFWMAKGAKGFRFDAIDGIGKILQAKITHDADLTHRYLAELKTCSYGKDSHILTVGETGGADIEEAKRYTNPKTGEMTMVFQFQLMNLDHLRNGDWIKRPITMADFKRVIGLWQTELNGQGWSGQFLGSHDFPRIVSRFGNDSPQYRDLSAKLLATLIFSLQGTPYIFQGDEIGMTNYPWQALSDFRDVESLNYANKMAAEGFSQEDIVARIGQNSRDNARTPIQWSGTEAGAGFTDVQSWIGINPNFSKINVSQSQRDQDSILAYYKKIIQLRKDNPVLQDGDYREIPDTPEAVFAFSRSDAAADLSVILNFSDRNLTWDSSFLANDAAVLAANYQDRQRGSFKETVLRPYEAIWLLSKKE